MLIGDAEFNTFMWDNIKLLTVSYTHPTPPITRFSILNSYLYIVFILYVRNTVSNLYWLLINYYDNFLGVGLCLSMLYPIS